MNTINVNMNFYPDIAFTPCRYVRIVIYLTYSCYLKDLVYKHLKSSSTYQWRKFTVFWAFTYMDFLCYVQPYQLIILMSVCDSEKNSFSMRNPRVVPSSLVRQWSVKSF